MARYLRPRYRKVLGRKDLHEKRNRERKKCCCGGVLTGTDRPRKYWDDLKRKLRAEGSELSEKIGQLKMQSTDGKFYNTDVAKLISLI